MMHLSTPSYSTRVALAIVLAGLILAVGVFALKQRTHNRAVEKERAPIQQIAMQELDDERHVLGDPTTPVRITVFFDTECPYCKTLHQLLLPMWEREYRSFSHVVYWHYPITYLHARSLTEHSALECAFREGGDEAFWAYLGRIFEYTSSNDGLSQDELYRIGREVGLSEEGLRGCVDTGVVEMRVRADLNKALRAGISKTPTVIISRGSEFTLIEGATLNKIKYEIKKYE